MSLQALVFGFQNLPSPRASLTPWVLVQEPWLEQDGFWRGTEERGVWALGHIT